MTPPITKAPTLEGPRLRLRGHRVADFPQLLELWRDPSVIKYISGMPLGEEEVWGRLLRYVGHWALLGYGYWAVEEKANGRYVGNVGFGNYHRQIDPPFHETPEAGWAIASFAQGKGYAKEAVGLTHDWADRNLLVPRTVCFLDEANEPSLKVALGAGYRKAYEAIYEGDAVSVFERLRRN